MRSLLTPPLMTILLAGCAETTAVIADEGGDVAIAEAVKRLPPEAELLADVEGRYLRTDQAEAFVAHKPMPRVYVFRRLGGANPLLIADHKYDGLRTAMMDPVQTANWDRQSSQPAEVVAATDTSIKLRGAVDPVARARAEMDVELGERDGRPALFVTHRVVNEDDRPREIAAWSIASIPNGGTMRAGYRREFDVPAGNPQVVRSVGFFMPGIAEGGTLAFGDDALTIDTGAPLAAGNGKVGVVSPDGVVTYTGDAVGLTSTGPAAEPGLVFPEGGYNVTFYKSWRPEEEAWHYTELEHVAPLEVLQPGEASELRQTIVLD